MKFASEAKIRKLWLAYIKIIDSDIFSYPFSKINEEYLFIKKIYIMLNRPLRNLTPSYLNPKILFEEPIYEALSLMTQVFHETRYYFNHWRRILLDWKVSMESHGDQ